VDVAGGAIVGGIAGVVVVHSTGMAIRYKRRGRIARKEAAAAAAAADAEKEAAAGGAVALATGPAPSAATPVAATPVAATPVAATQTDTAAQAEALAGTGVDDQDNVEPRA